MGGGMEVLGGPPNCGSCCHSFRMKMCLTCDLSPPKLALTCPRLVWEFHKAAFCVPGVAKGAEGGRLLQSPLPRSPWSPAARPQSQLRGCLFPTGAPAKGTS